MKITGKEFIRLTGMKSVQDMELTVNGLSLWWVRGKSVYTRGADEKEVKLASEDIIEVTGDIHAVVPFQTWAKAFSKE